MKLIDLVSGFDSTLITVKGWGVTIGLAAIGLGFKEKNWGYFLLAVVSGFSFWILEFTIKGHQMRYYPRIREIEYQMSDTARNPPAPKTSTSENPQIGYAESTSTKKNGCRGFSKADDPHEQPKIDWSWTQSKELLAGRKPPAEIAKMPMSLRSKDADYIWHHRLFLPHVMLPHVISVLVGGALWWLSYNRRGCFHDFGPNVDETTENRVDTSLP